MMEIKPLITVITASYNSKYLYESISSVLSQTYEKIEYIVADDGTEGFDKEDVELYIRKNQPSNIIFSLVIHHTNNIGTVQNLNYAIKMCHGKYVFFLSADDVYCDPYTLDKWVSDMEKKGSIISTSILLKYDEKLSALQFAFPFPYQKRLLMEGNKKYIFNELTNGNFILGCCTAYSRICFKKYGFFDEDYHLIEDYPYMLSYIRRNGRIDFFDHQCIKYRCGGVSSSQHFNDTYERDSDLIFRNEILPYVKFKYWHKLIYSQWKKNQKTGFWEKIANAGPLSKICLYFLNPVQICISLEHYIRNSFKFRRIRGGTNNADC